MPEFTTETSPLPPGFLPLSSEELEQTTGGFIYDFLQDQIFNAMAWCAIAPSGSCPGAPKRRF